MVWFLIVFPYLLCALVKVFTKSGGEVGLVEFFSVKLSEYLRMVGAMMIISIRTIISVIFLFPIFYILSLLLFGEFLPWIVISLALYILIYRSTRFMLAPFFIIKTTFSPNTCIVKGWNASGKYFWTLFLFSIFPLSIGFLSMIIFGHTYGITMILFALSITFSVILITPIASKVISWDTST